MDTAALAGGTLGEGRRPSLPAAAAAAETENDYAVTKRATPDIIAGGEGVGII